MYYRKSPRETNETPQRRRLAESTRRQWEVAPVAEDVHHVDDAANKVHEQPQEAAVDDEVADAQGFPGGPHDTSVLTAYVHHVAVNVWNGKKLSSHGRKVQKFDRPATKIEGLVVATRLSLMIPCSMDTSDQGLILAFVENWHKETCNFHLPIGEVTITLDSVASLLHLPITGSFHSFDTFQVDEVVLLLVELLKMKQELRQYSVIGHMFDNHGYETFIVANAITAEDYHERKSRACRWISKKALPVSMYQKRLDQLTSDGVCWMPYGNHRAVGEFELISLFFGHIRWGPTVVIHRLDRICVVPGQCAPNYIKWLYMISHPFMRPAQPKDPFRHPPVMQDDTYVEPNIPQYPVTATAMEEAPADAPSHEACQAIAERSKRLLNLRIVTEGTEAYNVMEDCLRIARGVTVNHNVYVRSQ
ncbi:Protein MAIN-LIKE 1 [Glycine soja]